jgi:hypothetical protein
VNASSNILDIVLDTRNSGRRRIIIESKPQGSSISLDIGILAYIQVNGD